MNPLDWSLIVGLLPVILLVSLLLEFAWLAAGRNVPVCSPLRRSAPGGSADGAALNPRRAMRDGSDVCSFSGGRNWRVRSGVLDRREGRLASRLGVTERA